MWDVSDMNVFSDEAVDKVVGNIVDNIVDNIIDDVIDNIELMYDEKRE